MEYRSTDEVPMKYRCQADAYVLQALCGGAHTQFDSTEFTSTSTNSCSKDLLSISFPSPSELLPPPFLPLSSPFLSPALKGKTKKKNPNVELVEEFDLSNELSVRLQQNSSSSHRQTNVSVSHVLRRRPAPNGKVSH